MKIYINYISYILLLPFIITPFLVSDIFQDPTLLIKKSGVFFTFSFIAIIFLLFKSKIYKHQKHNPKIILFTLLFMCVIAVISNFNSVNKVESYWEILYLFGWISIYIIFMQNSNITTLKMIIYSTTIISAILSLLLFNDVFNFFTFNIPSKGLMSSTFGFRNYFGQYLCFSIPASIVSLFMVNNKKYFILITIFLILSLGGLILTRTRAAWLAIFISLILFVYLNRQIIFTYIKIAWNHKYYKLLLLLLPTIIIYFTTLQITVSTNSTDTMDIHKGTFWQTITSIKKLTKEKSWNSRIEMYSSTIEMIKDKPLLGVGLGNWRLIQPKYYNNPQTDKENISWQYTSIIQRPHNDFLWFLSEVGLVGMIFVLWFFIFHIRLLIIRIKKDKNKLNTEWFVYMFCLMTILSISIESMFDFPKQRTVPNLYFWSIFGFISQLSIHNFNINKHKQLVSYLLPIILSIVSIFLYFDIKFNIYNQDSRNYNNKNMSNPLYLSSLKSLDYYRDIDNTGTPIYYYLGIAKYKLGDLKMSKVFFAKSLEIAPYHLGTLMNYMIVLGELNELEEAYKVMNITKNIYPKMSKPRLDMAKFFIKANQLNNAIDILIDLKHKNLDDYLNTRDKLLLYAKTRLKKS